ncbi:ABC transporter permease [Gardnerella sp. Marseille-Q2328]|uniref:ABC transporter permease n=1 Tax=Gardnerella sp. Marseille-Q2328 TaxID=2759694 RepID=UPI00202468B7|nr:ABC transporter permease [Gardnerella sp. Marseille-Q2328]
MSVGNKTKHTKSLGTKRSRSLFPALFISAVRMWCKEWRRFCVLAVIAMLGVAVLTGIYAGCNDMLLGANNMYAKLRSYDLQVASTLGLTRDDVTALQSLPAVSEVEAEYSRKATALPANDATSSYAVNLVHYVSARKQLNQLHLLRGTMPSNTREVAVTQRFLHDSGLHIGDTVVITVQQRKESSNKESSNKESSNKESSHKETPAKTEKKNETYRLRITASVLDSNDLNNPDGYQSKAFRNSVTSRYPMFTFADFRSVKKLPYTVISVRLKSAQNVNTFSQAYRNIVDEASKQIHERVQVTREKARRNQLVDNLTNLEARRIVASSKKLKGAPEQVVKQAYEKVRERIKPAIERRVPQARWHVITRIANESYASLRSDIASIQSLGYAFPAIFLIVAMMMSLTAMARMVEEERGLIGTYLSLGYGRSAAVTRHAFFAILACIIGGGIGDIVGFLAIPSLLLKILRGLYSVPDVTLRYDWLYGSLCVLAFVIPVAVCTIVVSWRETRQVPALLLRPKAPRAGARVLLERLPWIWNRMSFLNKVTVRNLARFKGRLCMTIGGVAGCTALIVCALALNDTVATLGIRQYEGIYRYDMIAVSAPESFKRMQSSIENDKSKHRIETVLASYVSSGEIAKYQSDGSDKSQHHATEDAESVQLIVVKDAATLARLVRLCDVDDNLRQVPLNDEGPLLSQSAAASLNIGRGDKIAITNVSFKRAVVKVRAIVRNLIGSNMYMTARCYERLFGAKGAKDATAAKQGQSVKENALIMRLRGSDNARIRYADAFAERDGVLRVINITRMKHAFSFDLMNAVVALIIALAAGLALAVLFTLASTNISERAREIATLKVLGFYRREVHAYVHKEMLILTLVGIAVGLPLGRFIAGMLTSALRMPSLYFEVEVAPLSYGIAGCVTLIFALIVQWSTNPALDRIDPVSSLKSVE